MESIFCCGSPHFSKIFDPFDLGIFVIMADFQITCVNQKACLILGCETDDLAGKYFTEEFSNSPIIVQCIKNSEQNQKQSGILRKRGSKAIPVTYWFTEVSGDSNESAERMFCFQPIEENSEHKFSEIYSLERIMASLIHEIRNPLGGIMGFTNLLEQDLAHQKSAHSMILKIRQAAESLEKLISSLTIISREKSNLSLKPVLSQNYFSRLFSSFQNEMSQKNFDIQFQKKFPQNDVIVAINPFSFNILWDIILQQFAKILQEKNFFLFEIIPSLDKVCFEINLNHPESRTVLLKSGFSLPEIKRVMIEKILHEHQGKYFSVDAHKKNPFVRIELPRFASETVS